QMTIVTIASYNHRAFSASRSKKPRCAGRSRKMRVFGLTLGRGARPSSPNGCANCSTGSSVARAETDRAARVIQLWDRGGSGWYSVSDGPTGGCRPAPGHNREWNGVWVPPHWGANPHYGVWAPYGRPVVPTYWVWGASGGP